MGRDLGVSAEMFGVQSFGFRKFSVECVYES